jgi:hypothetical protein
MNDFEKKIQSVLNDLNELYENNKHFFSFYNSELLSNSINDLKKIQMQIPKIDPLEKEDAIEKAYYAFPDNFSSISQAYDEGFLACLKIRDQQIK